MHVWQPRCIALCTAVSFWALAQVAPARAQDAGPAGAAAPQAAEPATPAAGGGQQAELEQELTQLGARLEEWKARSSEYEQARSEAPSRLEAIEREIAQLQERSAVEIDRKATPDELAAQLLGAEQDLSQARQEAVELDAEAARRAERRKKIPELLAAAKEKLRKLEPAPAAPAESALAQVESLRRAVLEAEILAYQNELSSYDARGVLLGKRRDRATLRIARFEGLAERLRDAVKQRQQLEAESNAQEARASLAGMEDLPESVRDVVRELAEQNSQLAERRTGDDGLVEKIDDVSRKIAHVEQQVAASEAEFANLREKVDVAGLSDSVGLLLRTQRANAPDVGKYRRFIRMRSELVGEVQLQQIELREQRRELADIDGLVEDALQEVAGPLSPAEFARVRALLHQLFETQRKYLDALIQDYETYFQKLVDFSALQQELVDRTVNLVDFIDERVLWIPSGTVVKPLLLTDGSEALRWLLSRRYWGQLGRALAEVTRDDPLLTGLVVLLLGLSVPLGRRVRPRLRELGELAASPACLRYGLSVEALALTLLLVPWLPGLLAYLGWRLGLSPDATQYTRSIAHGLLSAAFVWVSFGVPRQVLRTAGLAEAHFGWPAAAVRSLRRHLQWLALVAVPAVFLIEVYELRGEDAWKESLGRLVFVVALVCVSIFNHLVLREGGALVQLLRRRASPRAPGWVWRVLHWTGVALPLLLTAAALGGYFWTALQLSARVHLSLCFLFVLVVGFELVARWSLLAGRRVAIAQAARRREEARARLLEQSGPGEREAGVGLPEEEEVDLAAVRVQTSRLLTGATLLAALLGLWAVWADVLPAAGILRQVELWHVTRTVSVEVMDASGVPRLATESRIEPVTLADLALALLIALAALALVRNLPGLLEVSLFRRLGAGERYAYATIVKYGITIGGVTLAFDALGVGWSSIQWLVAAVGLGLGFGLQEIFANFVSGLIILFERPVRVGDTVTVGDVSGTVTKVRIRATWITGFDRKELVVPNKEFVTGRLVNWSLSDPTLRVDIPVGIAYGSDTELAIQVLRRCAEANEHVLRDPPPQVFFLGFGDSALSFELRAFSPDVSHFLVIKHQLHMAIDRAFREAGIEIAFPQRDLHLRSMPADWPTAAAPDAEPGSA